MGNNGDVVTVLAELADGLRLRTKDGQVADVQWRRMLEEKKQRVFLGHGHALTIDAAQAITSEEHITRCRVARRVSPDSQATSPKPGAERDLEARCSRRAASAGARRQHANHDRRPLEARGQDMSNKPYEALGTDLLAASQRDRERALDTFAQAKHWIDDAVRQDPGIAVKVADRVGAEAIDTSLGRQRLGLEASIAENARC